MRQFVKFVMFVGLVFGLWSVTAPSGAHASPPPSPMSFPGCEKIVQRDGVWIGSICPEMVWANGVPYNGFAIYYFGFLADKGDSVRVHFSVDGGAAHQMTMTKNEHVYYDFYNRNLFEARFIPYLPAHNEVSVEIHFSRLKQLHDEFGAHYKVDLRM